MNAKVFFISFSLFVASLVSPAICVVKSIKFTQDCSGYIKNAADANTVELAAARLDKAIEYVEEQGLTEGYTSALWRTEDENIGFWYDNLKACREELSECVDGTQLEKSNVLMKVRESLTDEGEDGTVLTIPAGISRYPNNLLWGILNIISTILFLVSVVLGIMGIEDYL